MGHVSDMRDQYNSLKAIDTSSSSPELKETQSPLGRPLRQQLRAATGLATTSSSNSSGAGGGQQVGFIRNKLQNLIRPKRFQLSGSSGDSKSSSCRQHEASRRSESHVDKQQETSNGQSESDEQTPLDNVECPQRRLFGSDELVRRQPFLRPQLQQVPSTHQTRKRVSRGQVMMPAGRNLPLRAHLSENKLATTGTTCRQTTSKTSTTPIANYTNQSDIAGAHQNKHELAKCYDEIDQIYDYIRGLAPLPAQLRKIKAIDFEQIEREHQRHQANQQQQLQQQIHHLHRQRFVKSISLAQNESGASSESTTNDSATNKKSIRVRQRVAPELVGSDQRRAKPSQNQVMIRTQASRPIKVKETQQFLAPMPIRVTTRASESQKPSIKRVESLNLSAVQRLEPKPMPTLEAKLIQQRKLKTTEAVELNSSKLSSYNLLRSTGVSPASHQQDNQLFRLPRAHSTSTLSKQPSCQADSRCGAQHPNLLRGRLLAPVIQEETPPVARSKGTAAEHATNSLNRRATPASKKRPSFESGLVESYVDDEDEKENGNEIRPKSNSSTSLKLRVPLLKPIRNFWTEMDNDDSGGKTSLSSSDSSHSDKWSYDGESSKNQTGGKSHSDYDHESASDSRTSAAGTISDSTATSSEAVEEDEEVRANFKSEAPPSRRASSTSKRSHRPTTSSSPSSGRPASPVDMTNESDDQSGSNMDDQSRSRGSSSSSSSSSSPSSAETSGEYKQPVHRHEEHIYEQIPSHRDKIQERQLSNGNAQALERHQQAIKFSKQLQARVSSSSSSSSANRKSASSSHTPSRSQQSASATINHPVAYAANVAANRRYQQQVAALFALQQKQRDRHQQPATNSRHKLEAVPLTGGSGAYHLGHQRRASTSNVQFMTTATPNPNVTISSGPTSLNVGSLKWRKHHQTTNELLDVPLRQRLSMSNIHLLSGLPLATLRSPRSKRHQQVNQQTSSAAKRLIEPRAASQRELSQRSLDDHDAESTTGTTNSTSSYEAAIKNSEPDPLRVDMISPLSDGEQLRPASSRRSNGSGSGSRSLTNHSHHHQVLQQNSGSNVQQQQPTSLLVKVPKLSKQSHLLKRPLPKPPAALNRTHASAGIYLRQPQKVSNLSRVRASAGGQPTKPVDVFTS